MPMLILTGDVNLQGVTDATVPFGRVADELRKADLVFSNLECLLCARPDGHSTSNEGFFTDPDVCAGALRQAGIGAVGIANNVHYGDAIGASIAQLDRLGIPHTGAGANLTAARAPIVVERDGIRLGFLQRSSIYWPTNHEAQKDSAGIAVIRGHTAYQIPLSRLTPHSLPPNRPGLPPEIITWADPAYLAEFKEDIARLRPQVDVLVASCHWGLKHEVLSYMTEIAHGAIDAGADIVVGHGPHFPLPVEVYRGKPVFYGLCNLSFHTGHRGRAHGDWVGMLARVGIDQKRINRATIQFVRHNERNETLLCELKNEGGTLSEITKASAAFGTRLTPRGNEVEIALSS
jgi:poly-gamma-glutamate synthesis protein (capsule biosynthesis protein)